MFFDKSFIDTINHVTTKIQLVDKKVIPIIDSFLSNKNRLPKNEQDRSFNFITLIDMKDDTIILQLSTKNEIGYKFKKDIAGAFNYKENIFIVNNARLYSNERNIEKIQNIFNRIFQLTNGVITFNYYKYMPSKNAKVPFNPIPSFSYFENYKYDEGGYNFIKSKHFPMSMFVILR